MQTKSLATDSRFQATSELLDLLHTNYMLFDIKGGYVKMGGKLFKEHGFPELITLDSFKKKIEPTDRISFFYTLRRIDEHSEVSGDTETSFHLTFIPQKISSTSLSISADLKKAEKFSNLIIACNIKGTRKNGRETPFFSMPHQDNFNALQQGLTITDEKGNFTYCNQAYADIVEMDAVDLIGRSPYDFIDMQSNNQLLKQSQVRKKGKTTQYVHTLIDSNGTKKKVSVTGVPIIEEGQFKGAISVVSQVDSLHEIQRELVEKDQVLEGVSRAMNALIMGKNFNQSVQNALAQVGRSINVDRVYIYRNHKDAQQNLCMSQQFEWCEDGVKPQINNTELQNIPYFPEFKQWYETLSNGSFYGGNVSDFPNLEEKKVLQDQNIKSLIALPIFSDNTFYGFVGFDDCKTERNWYANEISILMVLAAGIGSIISEYKSKSKLKKQKKFFENVLNTIPSDIVVFDSDHRYQFVNPIAVSDPDKRKWLIGKNDYEYCEHYNKPVSIADKRRKHFNTMLEKRKTHSWEEHFTDEHGEDKWVLRYLNPVYKPDGSLKMAIGFAIDITEQKKSEQKIEFLARFPQQNPYPILRVDKDCRFLYANPPGEKLQEFLEQKNFKKHKKTLELALKSGNLKKYQIKMGEQYYILNYAPIPNLGYVNIYGFDVTEKVEREKQLEKAREIANESLVMKEKFLSNMSHEIRTPLNGMNGVIHLLQSTKLSELQREYLDMLGTSSQHLLQLINEILDFSKLEQKKIELKTNPVDVKALIKESISNIQESANDKGLEVQTEGLDIFQQKLLTNKVRLRQILLNLLTNAVKFTDQGHIKLVCRKLGNHSNKMVFSISVIDTGVGIKEEDNESIFDSFNQVSNHSEKLYEGTGLGLSIVKELIHYMNGSINVQSTLGKGSTFTVKLELPYAEEDKSQNELTSDNSSKSLAGCKVLIVDDHKVNRIIIERILQNWDIAVISAENGKVAIESLENKKVDIILMDMQMPVMDGIEATKTIRGSQKSYSKVPIIAMTAAAMPEQKEKCLNSGMNGYISKPYNPDKLFEELKYYFNKDNGDDRKKRERIK